jgi:hypothetical protein
VSAVDVVTETVIDRPRADVAAYVSDAEDAKAWYRNITSVEWETERPARVGSRIAFVAPLMAGAMKRANTKDLALLKSILEAEPRR